LPRSDDPKKFAPSRLTFQGHSRSLEATRIGDLSLLISAPL